MHDLRLGWRALRATPLVTAVAVLSLALGIGANTAIFSIADGLLLRKLPVRGPDRLALLLSRDDPRFGRWSYPLWNEIRQRREDVFETAVAFSPARFDLSAGGETRFVEGLWVSGNFFAALGVPPVLGRTFEEADDQPSAGHAGAVAVISHAFWQRLGGTRDVIGRTQMIGAVPFTIVGVMPRHFAGVIVGSAFEVALPIAAEPLVSGRDSWLDRAGTSTLRVIVRLKDGQTRAAAEQAVRGVQPQIREATVALQPAYVNQATYLTEPFALHDVAYGISPLRDRYRQAVMAIVVVVALVLLIACANVANLLLARAAARRHEFSVRLALGGSRWRLARQLLVESLLLAGLAAACGLLLARWASEAIVRALSTQAGTVYLETPLDWRMLAFTAAIAVVVALGFGVLPAWEASSSRPMDAIRSHSRGIAGTPSTIGGTLVVAQVALSLVLVAAAGLFIRTFASLTTADLGFERDAALVARLDASRTGVAPAARPALYDRLLNSAHDRLGVSHAAISEVTPVSGLILDVAIEVENGKRVTTAGLAPYKNAITPGWFATYGTPIVAGRDFDARDTQGAPPVAIVNETFVQRLLHGRAPIGQRLRYPFAQGGEPDRWMEIVGVAADATYLSIRAGAPSTLYVPMAQQAQAPPSVSLSVRSAGASMLRAREVVDAIAQVDPRLAVTMTPLRDQIRASLVQERLVAMLSGFFGVLALILASLGLYGTTWQAVSQRRAEIGVRLAVGAAPSHVVRLVLTRVVVVVALGTAIGTGLTVWLSRYVAAMLYGLDPRDPATLAGAAAILALVGALAAWLPARRASQIDPSVVLRET